MDGEGTQEKGDINRAIDTTAAKRKSLHQIKERNNALIHLLYTRREFDECLKAIEEILKENDNRVEFPIYAKALILRQRGKIHESLELFKWAHILNPNSIDCLKQVGRSLYLLGKHRPAIEVYNEAQKLNEDDWEIWHNKGLCLMNLRDYEESADCFRQANLIQKHDVTYVQLGKVYALQEDFPNAIEVFDEALEFSPENPEILTTMGLLHLRQGQHNEAFVHLGNSLTLDPKNPKTILATGSIIQDRGDHDAALIKYRIAAVHNTNSAQLWNNIGMCFFGKQKYVAAVACLKKALYLDPFEWITSYNLGLVHLNVHQNASAFHYLSAALNIKPDFASTYMYLGVALNRLNDFENACNAFEKAISMERDHLFFLNYSVVLVNAGQIDSAKKMFGEFEVVFGELPEDIQSADVDVTEQRNLLSQTLK
eukprot:CAMPEP_0115007542 /NCGR_PEP_ID=MMETSP0216-20121206/21264_1 /TAXON_ID=223996 /ORGANISM="Protocruzia adherens, Strain Boccale" /LENGTH=425 /DNA_ID=CAMNT_0002374549 /DNA_START=39 /DNA_END=1316 /DNA_ORIENTATION=-